MKSKENPIFLTKSKNIQLFKNISVNLKCIKAQKIKLDIKINQNISNKNLNSNPISTINKTTVNNIKNNFQKNANIVNIKKIQPSKKINNNNKKRSKSTKSFSMNNSNKPNIKHSFIIKRNSKKQNNNISYKNSLVNTRKNKSEYYKKISLIKTNKSSNNAKIRKNKNNSKSHEISPINRPKKLIRNNAEINQSNPLELTFGSTSFMSNNIQTETNETEKEKSSIKNNNKFKNKNNFFMKSIISKKDLKEKNNINFKKNKIVKLNKKLLLRPSWKIRQNQLVYDTSKSLYNKEKEKSKEGKHNKSAFIKRNYNKETNYNDNFILDKSTINKINNISDIKNKINSKKDNQNNIRTIKIQQDKNLKSKFITFYKKNLLRNKIFNNRINIETKNKFENTKNSVKNYSFNESSFFENNIIDINKNKYKEKNNINKTNKIIRLNETKECILKINKSVSKENGKFKLIIKRTIADKCIKKTPKSTPKLLLTHPSFKNLFF